MRFCVGLTGGIGCGKSQAAAIFAELGAGVVDTDAISHDITRAGGRAMTPIADGFGDRYVNSEGGLDRAAMRELAFGDAAARLRLEEILHPLIRTEARNRIDSLRTPYVILVVPLLFETGAYADLISRTLVVDCGENQQIERTMARSGLSDAEVRAIMAAQLPSAERLARADDVLRNDGDIPALRERVQQLHEKYLSGAQSTR